MSKFPQATPTEASYQDYREIYGSPLIVFSLPDGRSYQWYPKRGEETPAVVLNVYDDGTRTASERMVRATEKG